MLDVSGYVDDREGLFQRLLELNSELMHSSYGLSEGRVVLSGAQELQNLDLNEFQAVLDDMTMALDTHLATLFSHRRLNWPPVDDVQLCRD